MNKKRIEKYRNDGNENENANTEMQVDVVEEDNYQYQLHSALGFKVQLVVALGENGQQQQQEDMTKEVVLVTVRWLKGVDVVLFDSFCGMLKRKLEGR